MADSPADPTHLPRYRIVGASETPLFSLPGEERLTKTFARMGLEPLASADGATEPGVLLVRADYVFERSVLDGLVGRPGAALYASDDEGLAALHVTHDIDAAAAALADGELPAGAQLEARTPEDLGVAYDQKLRKHRHLYVRRVTADNRVEIEKLLFGGAYKGVTDFVSKYVWPTANRHVTGLAARLKLRPNHVTFIGFLLVLAATWLFWHGHFGWGLAAGWLMAFLDSVDGKLARVTLTSSKFGDLFDHSIDVIHPPFWYWAWFVGLGPEFAARPDARFAFGAILVCYVLQRLQEGFFIAVFKIEMHIWRRFDSQFRTIIARRNPNLVILTFATLFGFPAEGFLAVAAWTLICFAIHFVQIAQAGLASRRGTIQSWLDAAAPLSDTANGGAS